MKIDIEVLQLVLYKARRRGVKELTIWQVHQMICEALDDARRETGHKPDARQLELIGGEDERS